MSDLNENNNQNSYVEVVDEVPEEEIKNKGMAIASMVLGILAIVPGCCCSIIGILLGIAAIVLAILVFNANKDSNARKGKGFAIAGLVLGITSVVVITLLFIIGSFMPIPDNYEEIEQFLEEYSGYEIE